MKTTTINSTKFEGSKPQSEMLHVKKNKQAHIVPQVIYSINFNLKFWNFFNKFLFETESSKPFELRTDSNEIETNFEVLQRISSSISNVHLENAAQVAWKLRTLRGTYWTRNTSVLCRFNQEISSQESKMCPLVATNLVSVSLLVANIRWMRLFASAHISICQTLSK